MQSAFVIALGALLFGTLGWAATTHAAPQIERALTREVHDRIGDAGLPTEQVLVDGRDVWVSAQLSGDAAFERVQTVLGGVEGIREIRRRISTASVQAPVEAASIDIAWSDSTLTLDGTLSTEADNNQLKLAIQERFPALIVTDNVESADNVISASWEGRIPEVVALVHDVMPAGGLSIKGLALVVRGNVANENIRTETGERLQAELPGMRVINRIRVPNGAAPAVAAALAGVFDGQPIDFEDRSDRLTAQAAALLERAAVVLEDHPDVTVRIEGYDDATGHPLRTDAVSRVKANVVRDFLIRRGVRPNSLVVQGMGSAEAAEDDLDGNAGRAKVRLVVHLE